MSYQVALAPSAVQEIAKLDSELQRQLAQKLEQLAFNPRPEDAIQLILKGTENLYRIRLGEYRVIYHIQEQSLLVTVIKIAHPKDYY
ncbi:type II toxin-antitoxin system RelE/ParE family toxin [Fischerella sp. JS2]|uniref:type II toxin-antitoxin system RelE family toxin n=1 Tax=Fischerella sp. JS2 TaxID=2597771 RepID=UPI0028EBDE1B|nr:type II toxin-antitoxin system RelE/ParE family toxin [Fischerella sp. JS2]